MDEFLITPAGRLYRFLEHCSIQESAYNKVATVEKIWSSYLGLDLDDGITTRLDLYAALGPILALPSAVRSDVDRIENPFAPKEELLEHLPRAEHALSYAGSLASPIEELNSTFDAGTLAGLKLLSRSLQRDLSYPNPTDDRIANLRSAVDILREEALAASDLDPRLREIVLDHVAKLSALLDRYQVSGPLAFVTEKERLVGTLASRPDLMQASNQASAVWTNLKKVFMAIALVGGAIEGTQLIIEQGQMLLGLTGTLAPSVTLAPAIGEIEAPEESL